MGDRRRPRCRPWVVVEARSGGEGGGEGRTLERRRRKLGQERRKKAGVEADGGGGRGARRRSGWRAREPAPEAGRLARARCDAASMNCARKGIRLRREVLLM